MANQTGIAIVIRAFLPTGKTLDEQFAALSAVKDAHATGDYAALLKLAKIDDVKTEQKTRRIEDAPTQTTATEDAGGGETTGAETANDGEQASEKPSDEAGDESVPKFLKDSRKPKAA